MREILFRGKSINNGKWYEGSLLSDCEHGDSRNKVVAIKETTTQINTYSCDLIPIIVDPKTVSQATGLKDKNGEMIFEGDKIAFLTYAQSKGKWSNGCESELKPGNIIFKEGCFGVDWDDKEVHFHKLSKQCATRIEIIGNIHDK